MKNALKSLSFLTLFGTLIFTTSCGDDDGGGDAVLDEESPVITLNAPAAGAIVAASSQVATSISISDDVEISSVSISVGNGTVSIFDLDETDIGSNSFTYNQNLSIPADVVLGSHTLDVSVTDASGNTSTASVNIEAYPVYTDGQTTVLVNTVPAQVTDYTADGNTIFMVGAHKGWDVNSGSHPLSIHTDSEGTSTFFQQVENTGVDGFKFVRAAEIGDDGWQFVEKDAVGKELDNRSVEASATSAAFDIASWADYNPVVNNDSQEDIIDGASTTKTISGSIGLARTSQSAISTVTYSILDADAMEVEGGSVTLDSENAFSFDVDISSYALGTYTIAVTAVDAAGSTGREDEILGLLEFPCSSEGLTAVANDMTRVFINVNTSLGSRDMIVTGKINGADVWGTISDDYRMTKISDGCYYIDLALAADDQLQFFYEEATHGADWWKGAATRVAGDGGTAALNVSDASSGNELKAVYGFWREDPPEN